MANNQQKRKKKNIIQLIFCYSTLNTGLFYMDLKKNKNKTKKKKKKKKKTLKFGFSLVQTSSATMPLPELVDFKIEDIVCLGSQGEKGKIIDIFRPLIPCISHV